MSLTPPDADSRPAAPTNGRGGARLAVVVVVVVALAAAAVFSILALVRQSTDEVSAGPTPAPTAGDVTPSATQEGKPSSDSGAVPTVADASGGILVNLDGTVGGTPPPGAVRVDIYLDLLCPVCRQFEEINEDALATMRADGTIAVYYHPVSILDAYSGGTRYPTRAASTLTTVAEYDPVHFEAYFGALFDNQPPENTVGLSTVELAQIATDVGVPASVTDRFADGLFEQWVTDATDAAVADGLRGTPWVRAEQTAELDGGIWSYAENTTIVLEYIHDNGLQAYLAAIQGG